MGWHGAPGAAASNSSSVFDGDALELDLRAEREPARAERAARRIRRREERLVDLVEFAPLRNVGEHHGALDDIAQRIAVRFERRAQVFERLPSFFLEAARHELELAGLHADLAG